ncbi:peroxide stress protein YaaA [soil metagenome]
MLLLLPPSETKRDGGDSGALDLSTLRFPELRAQRRASIAALRRLSRSVGESTRALGLGPTQRFEIERNRVFTTASTMPAMDRFTGVVYEALDAPSLPEESRAWLARTVVIQSALLGPIGAADLVPAYRLSADSRLPGLPLKKHWADSTSAVLARHPGPILDLRSEGYAALGPVPARPDARYLRVVTEAAGGQQNGHQGGHRRALNHFNKKGKGEFVRELALAGIDHASIDALLDWARGRGIRLENSPNPAELDLVV